MELMEPGENFSKYQAVCLKVIRFSFKIKLSVKNVKIPASGRFCRSTLLFSFFNVVTNLSQHISQSCFEAIYRDYLCKNNIFAFLLLIALWIQALVDVF